MSVIVPAAASGGFEAPGVVDFWQPLIGSGAWALTRPAVVMVLVTGVLCAVMILSTRSLRLVPSKGQAALEAVYDFVRQGIARDIIGASQMRPHLPMLFSLFTIILVNNLMGIVPVVQFPSTGRIGIPVALMLFVYVTYLVIGFRHKGPIGYFRAMVPQGLNFFLALYVFVLELITYFITRPLTLALRLFGNMFAGHILLLLFAVGGEYMILHGSFALHLAGVGSWVMYFVMTVFELLIEFIQAYIFTLLAAFYIADSLADEH